MPERTDAITNEALEPIIFFPAYLTLLHIKQGPA
jgi:hypothetical protein